MRDKQRKVDAPPLEPPLMATLPGAAYLLSTRNCLKEKGLSRL